MGDDYNLRPRLCTVRKWADFPGYGFNLHAERGRAGQYIGKVDEDSPAQAAGMKEGDRIVEINDTNIGNENHSQVVNRIKASGEHVSMLLVDSETDKYFKDEKKVVQNSMSEVVRLETPPRPGSDEKEDEVEEQPQRVETPPPSPPTYDEVEEDDTQAEQEREPSPEPEREPTPEPEPEPEPERAPTPEPVVTISTPSHKYHPRNCHVKKWPHFQGYGFNLHAEKDKTGQYIGLVDAGSPSEECDLRKGDRIIEVNGENIEDKSHSEVIQKIKAGGEETTLLVVDPEADEYYKNNGITISSSLPEVIHNVTSQQDAPVSAMTYTPRSCHVIKWADFNGYGFNLHAEKERGGQYIGKIDDNSPAESAGLREHDRIIEVNGENIENETHQQVIMRIKAGGDETKMLVVDKEADNHYKSRGITVSSSMSETKFIQTTRRTTSSSSAVTNGDSPRTMTAPVSAPVSQPSRVEPTPAPQAQANGGDFLSMKLSAAEMRAQLQSKRKTDPKNKSNLDFKTKHDIFQKM